MELAINFPDCIQSHRIDSLTTLGIHSIHMRYKYPNEIYSPDHQFYTLPEGDQKLYEDLHDVVNTYISTLDLNLSKKRQTRLIYEFIDSHFQSKSV